MVRLIVGLIVAGAVFGGNAASQQAGGAAQAQTQGQVQGQQGPPVRQGNRQARPASRAEAEQMLRTSVTNRLRSVMEVPDSQLERLVAISFRYRDSALFLGDRERFIRNQLGNEASTRNGRVPNEERISCLMTAFWVAQQDRLNVRAGEHREVAAFLSPIKRYRYYSFQENLYDLIDDAQDRMNRQFGRNGRGGDPGPGGPGGVRGGPPPADRAGQPPPPPPGGRVGQPGGRVGQPGGGRGGRGPFASICPPAAPPAGRGG